MRLIDAHDIEYEHICGEFRVSEEKINAMPTICDIDAIRAEIKDAYDDNRAYEQDDVAYGLKVALDIIKEHTKGDN